MGETAKSAPSVQTQLQPAQGELGRSARFVINFSGDAPINVKWLHGGKELKSAFDTQIKTTETESVLELNKLKQAHQGEYKVQLSNVGGQIESTANLTVTDATPKGVAPTFKQRVADQRAQQGGVVKFSCSISGTR